METTKCDILIVGAGVIGATLARSLGLARRERSIVVLEKESAPAQHTSGRNSGVLHSGFNPEPGSLKARFCVEGNARAREYCQKHNVRFEMCGTVVVAQNLAEAEVLAELLRRGRENNVPGIQMLSQSELNEKEPHVQGTTALFSPTGSIVDSAGFVNAVVAEAQSLGVQFLFKHKVKVVVEKTSGIEITCANGQVFSGAQFVNCAGLYADRLAHQLGVGLEYTIIPFRGQYYRLTPAKKNLLKSMVYPAPDLRYPFLGVHWTRTVGGDTLAGPNAVLAFGREAYSPFRLNVLESLDMVLDSRFWKMLSSDHFRKMAAFQLRISFSKKQFAKEGAKLLPQITPRDLEVYPKAGNRPQLINKDGHLVEDLVVQKKGSGLHILNSVSPGFTSSLAFADHLAAQL